MQIAIEKVTRGMRIGLTQVVTKVEQVGPDEYLLETHMGDLQSLGIPANTRTYSRGHLISIEDEND